MPRQPHYVNAWDQIYTDNPHLFHEEHPDFQ